jgi:hypothetical protein
MSRTNEPQVVYTPHPHISSGDELGALVLVYRFVLDCRAKKLGDSTIAALDDGKVRSKHVPATQNDTK